MKKISKTTMPKILGSIVFLVLFCFSMSACDGGDEGTPNVLTGTRWESNEVKWMDFKVGDDRVETLKVTEHSYEFLNNTHGEFGIETEIGPLITKFEYVVTDNTVTMTGFGARPPKVKTTTFSDDEGMEVEGMVYTKKR